MILAKKADLMTVQLVKAILFFVLAILVFMFLSRVFTATKAVPEWSKSLSAVERAIANLDDKSISLTRTANIQLDKYFIRGYTESGGVCITVQDKANCICACKDSSCTNAKEDPEKFCKSVLYKPSNDFKIGPNIPDPVTYKIGLQMIGSEPQVKIMGVIN